MRFGSAGEPLRWYISQPAKCVPLTSQFWRLPSAVRMNAPFFVPTSNRILLMLSVSFNGFRSVNDSTNERTDSGHSKQLFSFFSNRFLIETARPLNQNSLSETAD